MGAQELFLALQEHQFNMLEVEAVEAEQSIPTYQVMVWLGVALVADLAAQLLFQTVKQDMLTQVVVVVVHLAMEQMVLLAALVVQA
jgi:hypothetical protein